MLTNMTAILMVVFGLGLLIFVHELGHFLVAKWNGVKVEKFAIGFDLFNLKLYSKTIGETTYVIGALPLGGYVKMLGEEPGEAQAAEVANDPRAYQNKPVGARMAIISAGVVMNILFGIGCFSYVYMKGKPEIPPIIGGVLAGMPAYDAGMLAGDKVLSIDGRPVMTFDDLRKASIFSGKGDVLRIELQRPGLAEPLKVEASPRLRDGGLAPSLGISPPSDLELFKYQPFIPPGGFEGDRARTEELLRGGGTVVAASVPGQAARGLDSFIDLAALSAENASEPLEVRIRRGNKPKAGEPEPTTTVVLPPNRFVDLGLRMTAGPVAGVRKGGAADLAGIQADDRIVSIDGRTDFDPMRLPNEVFEKAKQGQAITIELDRAASKDHSAQRLSKSIKPEPMPPWLEPAFADEPLDVPGLGLALRVEPLIAEVREGSPAAAAGLKPRQMIQTVTLTMPAERLSDDAAAAKVETRRLVLSGRKPAKNEEAASWPSLFDRLQRLPLHTVEIGVLGLEKPLRVEPEPVADWFHPNRGLEFVQMVRPLPPQSLPSALAYAWGDTLENASAIYYILRGLIQRRLGAGAVGGPIKIADWAYSTAQLGIDAFLWFLGVLSINLAVVNFFPIPPLDGGQLLLLLAEKVRGKPIPERLAGPVIIAGLTLVLLLFVVVMFKDVLSYF